MIKPPYKPDSLRLRKRKPMTYILGLNCIDGIVLCADSQEGDGVNKNSVRKLFNYQVGDEWGFGFGCAGSSPAIKNFTDKIKDLLGNESYDRRGTEKIIEGALAYMHQQYPDESLALVAGIWGADEYETRLYRSYANSHCLGFEDESACTGQDVTLQAFLLASMFDPLVNVEEGARLAVFVTRIVGEHADGVGGQTNIISYKKGARSWRRYDAGEIAAIESEVPYGDAYWSLWRYWRGKHSLPSGKADLIKPRKKAFTQSTSRK